MFNTESYWSFIFLASLCQDKKSSSIIAPGLIDGNLKIDEGNNLTLQCHIVGVGGDEKEHWEFTSDNDRSAVNETYDSDNRTFDITTCVQTGELIIHEISTNQSGNYTCVYGDLQPQPYIHVQVISEFMRAVFSHKHCYTCL